MTIVNTIIVQSKKNKSRWLTGITLQLTVFYSTKTYFVKWRKMIGQFIELINSCIYRLNHAGVKICRQPKVCS